MAHAPGVRRAAVKCAQRLWLAQLVRAGGVALALGWGVSLAALLGLLWWGVSPLDWPWLALWAVWPLVSLAWATPAVLRTVAGLHGGGERGARLRMRGAGALDAALGLSDRMGSALALAEDPGAFSRLAVRDGEAAAERALAGVIRAAPVRFGRLWLVWPATAAVCAAVAAWVSPRGAGAAATQDEARAGIAGALAEVKRELTAAAETAAGESEGGTSPDAAAAEGPIDEASDNAGTLAARRAAAEAAEAVAEIERQLAERRTEPAEAAALAAEALQRAASTHADEAERALARDDAVREALSRLPPQASAEAERLAEAFRSGDLAAARAAAKRLLSGGAMEAEESPAAEGTAPAGEAREAGEDAIVPSPPTAQTATAASGDDAPAGAAGPNEPTRGPTAEASGEPRPQDAPAASPNDAASVAASLRRLAEELERGRPADETPKPTSDAPAQDRTDEARDESPNRGDDAVGNAGDETGDTAGDTGGDTGGDGANQDQARREPVDPASAKPPAEPATSASPPDAGRGAATPAATNPRRDATGGGQDPQDPRAPAERQAEREAADDLRRLADALDGGGTPSDTTPQDTRKRSDEAPGSRPTDSPSGTPRPRPSPSAAEGADSNSEPGDRQAQAAGERSETQRERASATEQGEASDKSRPPDGVREPEPWRDAASAPEQVEPGSPRPTPGRGETPDPASAEDNGEGPDVEQMPAGGRPPGERPGEPPGGSPTDRISPEAIDRALDALERNRSLARELSRDAGSLREQAERLLERASPEQRERMERLAREMADANRESVPPDGEAGSPDQPNSDQPDAGRRNPTGSRAERPDPAAGGDGEPSTPGALSERPGLAGERGAEGGRHDGGEDAGVPSPRGDAAWPIREETMDLRGSGQGDGSGEGPANFAGQRPRSEGEAARNAPARTPEALREAARGAQRAIERRAVPPRYQDLVRRVFERYSQRAEGDGAPARPADDAGSARPAGDGGAASPGGR